MNEESRARVRIHGYCDRDEEAVLAALDAHGPRVLSTFGGIYSLSVERGGDVYLATCHTGMHQYYYCARGGRFFHGPTLSSVLAASGLPWRWDFEALGDVLQLEFLPDEKTLHPDVLRMPAGAVLHAENGTARFIRRDTWAERYEQSAGAPRTPDELAEEARRALNDETEKWASGRSSVLALSGGYDSRVILGALLRVGARPHLVTMGPPDATDVVVAQKIAEGLGLSHQRVPIEIDDYLRHAPRIAELSGGAQVAWHWHAYIYPKKAGLDRSTLLFGGNGGEFSANGNQRSQLDFGLATRMVDAAIDRAGLSGEVLIPYWLRKQQRPFRPDELRRAHDGVARQFGREERLARASRCARFEQGSALERLDKWFLAQRTRSFHGVTQNLVCDSSTPVQPFINRRWIEAIWHLDRRWKQGLRWIRYALKANYPELLNYPEVGKKGIIAERIDAQPPALYWAKKSAYLSPMVPFADHDKTFRDPAILDTIAGSRGLEDLFDRGMILGIVEAQRRGVTRTRTVALLLLLAAWTEHLKTLYQEREQSAAA